MDMNARIRLSIDIDLDLRNEFMTVICKGWKTSLLNAVIKDLVAIAKQPNGQHILLDIMTEKLSIKEAVNEYIEERPNIT